MATTTTRKTRTTTPKNTTPKEAPVTATTTPAPVTTPANPVISEADALALRTAELVSAWRAVDKGETDARKLFDDAKIAWENTRVVKARVAYQVAMLNPYNGKANLNHATRVLKLTDADLEASAKDIKANVKRQKSSLASYVKAGEALADAGLVERTTEPDANERKIVGDVFKAGNKRPADAPAPAGGEGGEGGEGDAPAPDAPDALTVADLMGHIGRLEATLKQIMKASVVVSEGDADQIKDMLATFTAKLDEYAEGK